MQTETAKPAHTEQAVAVIAKASLQKNGGVCALIDEQQIAVFYLPSMEPAVYALGNWDPVGRANVLSRGLIGDIDGEAVVASPLYKQHFSLRSGRCIEDESIAVPTYRASLKGDVLIISLVETA